MGSLLTAVKLYWSHTRMSHCWSLVLSVLKSMLIIVRTTNLIAWVRSLISIAAFLVFIWLIIYYRILEHLLKFTSTSLWIYHENQWPLLVNEKVVGEWEEEKRWERCQNQRKADEARTQMGKGKLNAVLLKLAKIREQGSKNRRDRTGQKQIPSRQNKRIQVYRCRMKGPRPV